MNNNYKAILELDRKLTYYNIPHELVRFFDGWQICYPDENNKTFDVIENCMSRGHEMDRMEAYGHGFDNAKGFLDVDAALELFQNAQWIDYKKDGESE